MVSCREQTLNIFGGRNSLLSDAGMHKNGEFFCRQRELCGVDCQYCIVQTVETVCVGSTYCISLPTALYNIV
jgi:hypothetical protein